MTEFVLGFNEISSHDIAKVGGKNASLGEMIRHLTSLGIRVPMGFATTAAAYRSFLEYENLGKRIEQRLLELDVEDVEALTAAGAEIRRWILETPLPSELVDAVQKEYTALTEGDEQVALAVRSSATAEDLPEASFAGQQETYLNIVGLASVLEAVRKVYASLFNDRAIAYRKHQGFDNTSLALSAGIQRMVRSETASSGVMFTLDTESGFDDVVLVTSTYGLGETLVQGAVNPDEFYVHKENLRAGRPAILRRNLGAKAVKMVYQTDVAVNEPVETQRVSKELRRLFSISDAEVQALAQQALLIEEHYGCPMDIEWAKDGDDGLIYIVQARPETVKGRSSKQTIERYLLKETSEALVEGRSVGHRIGKGAVRVMDSIGDMHSFQQGDVLVADMTDPDWEPVMKRAAAIVTNRGGRTCHAAIIARELGIPAVVGCEDATRYLKNGQEVTVSCAEGDIGYVYKGALEFDVRTSSVDSMPEIATKIMMNVGNPDRAFDFQAIPNNGVGLARLEFIINRMIGVHPKVLLNFDEIPEEIRATVERRISGYSDPVSFYVEKLVEGISSLAAAFWPKQVIVRLSDFKSNEYANLVGGRLYEPEEENPMLGFRGASRYITESFHDCFELECRAIKKVRDDMGFTNVEVMVPFVRTVGEAEQVVDLLAEKGLKRGDNGLRLIMMCELPANALLADKFLEHFDGFSVGSNDLTQLALGLDRDSGIVAHLFDERNEAVLKLLEMAIDACKKANKYVGICGQGPSDHPELARWLMDKGIDSISFNPDSVLETWFFLSNTND